MPRYDIKVTFLPSFPIIFFTVSTARLLRHRVSDVQAQGERKTGIAHSMCHTEDRNLESTDILIAYYARENFYRQDGSGHL